MASVSVCEITSASSAPTANARLSRRRRFSPGVGRALTVLGRAIEHLTDDLAHEGASPTARNPRIEAVLVLMTLNRQIYLECPELPSLSERFRAMFGTHTIWTTLVARYGASAPSAGLHVALSSVRRSV
jgi:hypothetical protein